MNEPTRPNFQMHRAHPVAGPGIEREVDDWVIPTDKPSGNELMPPRAARREVMPIEGGIREPEPSANERQPGAVVTPQREEVMPQQSSPLQENVHLPKLKGAAVRTRRPTELETATEIIDIIKRQVRPQARRRVALMIYSTFK